MLNKSIYIPENAEAKFILERVKALEEMYKASFSELVFEGLKLLIQSNKVGDKKPNFRTPELGAK
jgi:hypothetical protein